MPPGLMVFGCQCLVKAPLKSSRHMHEHVAGHQRLTSTAVLVLLQGTAAWLTRMTGCACRTWQQQQLLLHRTALVAQDTAQPPGKLAG
jgi:hypothetical protein